MIDTEKKICRCEYKTELLTKFMRIGSTEFESKDAFLAEMLKLGNEISDHLLDEFFEGEKHD